MRSGPLLSVLVVCGAAWGCDHELVVPLAEFTGGHARLTAEARGGSASRWTLTLSPVAWPLTPLGELDPSAYDGPCLVLGELPEVTIAGAPLEEVERFPGGLLPGAGPPRCGPPQLTWDSSSLPPQTEPGGYLEIVDARTKLRIRDVGLTTAPRFAAPAPEGARAAPGDVVELLFPAPFTFAEGTVPSVKLVVNEPAGRAPVELEAVGLHRSAGGTVLEVLLPPFAPPQGTDQVEATLLIDAQPEVLKIDDCPDLGGCVVRATQHGTPLTLRFAAP